VATRNDRIDASGSLFARSPRRRRGAAGGETPLDRFEADVAQRSVAVDRQFEQLGTNLGMTLADGFAAALGGALRGKNPFKAFGNVVLAGLGSIMQQMGQAMIAKGVILLKLLPFLSNPFSSGPALIAAGIAISALGATLGGIAGGAGGGGGGGGAVSRDRATTITLTADGAGGFTAPKQQTGQVIQVLGKDSPEGQKLFAQFGKGAVRRNL
jgi:hypothetical protein